VCSVVRGQANKVSPWSRADAKFFLTWIDDLALLVRFRDRVPNEELRQHIETQLDAARTVYARIARQGK